MKLRKINSSKDINIVKNFFYDIFWEETDYDLSHFKDSVTGKHDFQRLEYYMGYENGVPIGISGIYADNENECWLGWFGIRPEHRQKGYATTMLRLQLDIMKNYGYNICRLYTNKQINKTAVQLYIKNGFTKDSDYKNHIITMAKPLKGGVHVPKWQGMMPLGFVPES